MLKRVYILVAEKNDAFLGVYATEQEAFDVGKAFRFETKILFWNIVFPLDFSKIDKALEEAKAAVHAAKRGTFPQIPAKI